jgi:hypothetical protein
MAVKICGILQKMCGMLQQISEILCMSTITGVCQHPLYCEQSVRQITCNDPDLKRYKKNSVCILLYYQLHNCDTNAGKFL